MAEVNLAAGAYADLISHRVQLQTPESFDAVHTLSSIPNDSNMIFHELRSTIFPSDQILGAVGMFVHRILTLDPERTMSLDTIAPERRLGEITDIATAIRNLSEEVVTVLEDQDAHPLPAGDLSLINATFGSNLA